MRFSPRRFTDRVRRSCWNGWKARTFSRHRPAPTTTAETYAVVALLHDICKADFYAKSTRNQKNSDGKWETVPCYTVREKFPFGHGEKSAFLVQRFMLLTDAEALAIRWHMGAYDDAAKGGSKVLSAAMAATPLVYALHAADMRAEQKENAQQ